MVLKISGVLNALAVDYINEAPISTLQRIGNPFFYFQSDYLVGLLADWEQKIGALLIGALLLRSIKFLEIPEFSGVTVRSILQVSFFFFLYFYKMVDYVSSFLCGFRDHLLLRLDRL